MGLVARITDDRNAPWHPSADDAKHHTVTFRKQRATMRAVDGDR